MEKSPFQACVYYIGKQKFVDQRWGTRQPITLRDPDFGIVRLRGFGKYSFRVEDATVFVNEIVGTQGKVTTQEVSNYLRDLILAGLTDLIGTSEIGLLNMAAKFDELAAAGRAKLAEQFRSLGLELTDLMINSISPPEEVQKAIDARSSMSALQDLKSYTLYQAANGMASMGQAEGSSAAAMGLGAGMGMMLPPILQQAMQGGVPQSPAPAQPPVAASQPAPAASSLDFGALNQSAPTDVRDTLRAIIKQAGFALQESEQTWKVEVKLGELRKQFVFVDFDQQDEKGHAIISFWSSCGPINPSQAMTLLRFNSQLVHAAFSLKQIDGNEMLTLRGNLLADTADQLELTRTLTAVAWQADRVEQQLTNEDLL